MNQDIRSKHRPNGAFVSVGAGIGLGTLVSAITGDWYWMPVVLAACIVLGDWLRGRPSGDRLR